MSKVKIDFKDNLCSDIYIDGQKIKHVCDIRIIMDARDKIPYFNITGMITELEMETLDNASITINNMQGQCLSCVVPHLSHTENVLVEIPQEFRDAITAAAKSLSAEEVDSVKVDLLESLNQTIAKLVAMSRNAKSECNGEKLG